MVLIPMREVVLSLNELIMVKYLQTGWPLASAGHACEVAGASPPRITAQLDGGLQALLAIFLEATTVSSRQTNLFLRSGQSRALAEPKNTRALILSQDRARVGRVGTAWGHHHLASHQPLASPPSILFTDGMWSECW